MRFYTEDYEYTKEAYKFTAAFMPALKKEIDDRFADGTIPEKLLYDMCEEVRSVLHGEEPVRDKEISESMAEIRKTVSEYVEKGCPKEFLFYTFNMEVNTEIAIIVMKKGLEIRKKRSEQRKAGC